MTPFQPLADSLRLNSPLPWSVYNAQGKLLLSKGFVLTEEKQIAVLRQYGAFVSEGDGASQAVPQVEKPGVNPFTRVEELYRRLGKLLGETSADSQFVEKLVELRSLLVELIQGDIDAAIYAMLQLDQPRYPISHALQTGFLCALIASRLEDRSEAEKDALVGAALTMNIAIVDLQTALSRQDQPPTEEQQAEIRSHPIRGRQRLQSLGVRDAELLRAVEQHHEISDGSGYPAGVKDVSPLAEIIRGCDKYWAMVSPRSNRKPMPPKQVARALYMAASAPGGSVAALIVKEMGLYPPGSYVKLANGEHAIVVARGQKATTPHVRSYQHANGAAFIDPLLRNTGRPGLEVVDAIPADTIIVSMNGPRMFGY